MAAVRMLEQVARGELEVTVPPAGSTDSLSTLPVQGEPTPGELPSIPPSGTRPPNVTPSGNRTPEGLPAPPEAGTDGTASGPPRAVAVSATPGELPVVAPRRSQIPEDRRPPPYVLLAGGALLAGAAIVAVIAFRSGGRGSADAPAVPPQEPAVAAAPPDAAPMAAAADAAPSTPDPVEAVKPAEVFVTIEGAPPNTEVRRGGVLLGIAPRVQMPRGDAEVLLVLSADGHVPATLTVIPSEDLSRTVKLKPKAAAARPRVPPRGGSAARPPGPGSGSSVEPSDDIPDFPSKAPPPPT
jgi:hypothetical protein